MEEIETLRVEFEALKARVAALEGEQEQAPDPLLIGTEVFREAQRQKRRVKR